MKKTCYFLLIFLFAGTYFVVGQTITATGGDKPVYVERGIEITKIDSIFLFYGMTDAKLTYTSPTPSSLITWKKYKYQDNQIVITNLSGNQTENVSVLTDIQPDYGYIVIDEKIDEENVYADTMIVWVTDYTQYISDARKLNVIEDDDKCNSVILQANIPDIFYYSFAHGTKEKLTRTYEIMYETLKWNESRKQYDVEKQTITATNVYSDENTVRLRVNAPLADTNFTMKEKRYAGDAFGYDYSTISDTYTAVQVDVHAYASVTGRKGSGNEITPPDSTFGTFSVSASAPVIVDFVGYASDAARHFSWEFSSRDDFSVLTATYPQQDLSFTFDRTGTYYVRLNVSDLFNNCSAVSDLFVINVHESFIEAPNYFTPGSTAGRNAEFKVSYKSIRKFKCSIYNRWGGFVYEYTDPALGWDGTINGKLVPPGVYFYVIEAEGSDGIKHKLKGDINLIYSK